MKPLQRQIFALGITLVIASIIVMAILSYYQTRKVKDVSTRISYTRNVLLQLSDLYNTTIEHAGAARNYSLNANKEEIATIQTTASNLQSKLSEIKKIARQDSAVRARLDSLEKYINKRIAFSNQLIAKEKESGFAAVTFLYQTGTGRDYNNAVFLFIQQLQSDELSNLQLDEEKNTHSIQQLGSYLLGLVAFIFVLVVILVRKGRLDMINRKKTEEQLTNFNLQLQQKVEEKTAELISVFDRITDGFIALDKNFCFTYVNKKAGEMTNRDPGSFIGKNMWEEFDKNISQQFRNAMLTAMREQRYVYLEEYSPAYSRWFEDHLYPSPEGLSIFYRDISERKKAEEAIHKSEERYRALIEQASDAIIITDQKGNFIEVNTSFCNKFGYTKDELTGLNVSKVMDPEQLKNDPIRFDLLLAGETIFRERRMMHKDGRIIEVEANVKMLPDGRMLAIARDITERKKTWQEMERVRYQLNERIKELTTLYRAGQILQAENKSVLNILQEIVSILPAGWQYPDIAAARIILGGSEYSTPNFADGPYKQTANFPITGGMNCRIEIVYLEERPEETEGPFLAEERNLINMLAEMLRTYFVRKAAAEQLLNEKNLSDSIINSLPGVFYFYDQTGKFIRWNKRFETVTGYNGEEISQMHPIDFFEEEDVERIKKCIHDVLETGASNAEASFVTKNKKRIPYYFTGVSIELDSMPCVLGTGMDITERKKAEEELRISEQKYKLLFDNNPLPIIMFSKNDLSIIEVNAAAIYHYGYSQKEFLQMSVKDLRPPEEISRFMEKISSPIANQSSLGTWKHKKKDGTIIDVEVSGHDIAYRDIPARLVLCNDVTEKLKAQENLQRSYEEIRQLASNIENIREDEKIKIAREIHDELGQQLTGLKMDVAWLSKKINPSETAQQEKIKQILSLLDETVKSVRRIASELRPGLLDDLGLVAAMEWHSNEFEKRSGIKVEFTSSGEDDNVPSRIATGLFRIFQESLTNVARHAQAKKINASLEIKEDAATLKISDDGKGFDAKEIENKKTLGLLGMKERMMMMGGKYEITGKPGDGTTVLVTVSLAKSNHSTTIQKIINP